MIMGAVTVGTSMYNSGRIGNLETAMNTVSRYMAQHQKSLSVLHKDMIDVQKEGLEIHEFAAAGLSEVYKNLGAARCEMYQEVQKLAIHTDLASFRAYVRDILDAIIESATTGKLTPRIMPAHLLRKLLNENPRTRNSVVAGDISLVYKFGRVIPISIDYVNLRYGFILEIPVPKEGDILPLYSIYNNGFETDKLMGKEDRVTRSRGE